MSDKDPTLRYIGGCALVLVVLVVLVCVGVFFVGWNLTRDATPGRPEESFLLGDETRYWSFDLKPDDAGLVAVAAAMNAAAESARDDALKNSPLRYFGLHGRRNDINQILPLKVELARTATPGWAARLTLSKGMFRVRAGLKMIRWIVGRDPSKSSSSQVGDVEVTSLRDRNLAGEIAFATVGNRLLLAGDVPRLERVLATAGAHGSPRDPSIDTLHEAIRQDGEDGWAFTLGPVVASFDVNARDELAFKIVSTARADDPLAQARGFLPYLSEEAFQLDDGSPRELANGSWLVSGRVTELSRRLAAAFLRFSASRSEGRPRPGSPSASPSPPSPRPSPDPRTGTPEGTKREGTPSPVR